MNNKDIITKIKAEIERLKEKAERRPHATPLEGFECMGKIKVCNELLSFLSTLESEKPINPADAMKELDEKIALVKQRGTWDGVDVDKYMDEVRGREPEKPMDLEEEIAIYLNRELLNRIKNDDTIDGFTTFDAGDIARHFYDLGCTRTAEKYDEIEYNRQRAEESVPKDLEEYASRAGFDYVDNIVQEHPGHRFNDHDVEFAYRDGIIAGAKWQENKVQETIKLAEDHAFLAGADWNEEEMLKGAAQGEFMLNPYPIICLDECKDYDFKDGDEVRIIIV